MRQLKQSSAANVMIFMTDSSDHVSGKAGLTLTITESKDGAAFASIAPTISDLGSGWYNLALTTAHTDTLGDLALHVTGAAADPTDTLCRVVAGALDADVSSRLATTGYTAPDNAGISAIDGRLPSDPADESALEAAIATRAAPGAAMTLTGAYDAAKTAAAPGAAMALTSAYEAAKTAAQAGDAMTLQTPELAAIAQEVLTHDITPYQATAPKPSLLSVVLHAVSRVQRIGTLLKEFRLDGTTVHLTHTITEDDTLKPISNIGVGS